jgi:hypothetical protein
MEGRCATCRWWKHTEHTDWGQCVLAESGWESTADFLDPAKREALESEHESLPSSLAVAQDDEEDHAWLSTHRDFGCVQYSKRHDS